jgi:2,3-bisphosphoglycerate-independent phosphoglycerate mutase
MPSYKTIMFLGDGMADEPVHELGGKTPLQYARTPAMDSIARDGVSGTLLTLPAGYPTSSEVANMSVLGCDLATEYCGRGPLEAAGRNIPLGPDDIAFRLNLVTVENGILKDFSAGHINGEDAGELIDLLNQKFGGDGIKFYSGVSYRNILVLSGKRFSHKVKTEKPDDNHGEPIDKHLPVALDPEADFTVSFLRKLMLEAQEIMKDAPVNKRLKAKGLPPANGVWAWSGGKAGSIRSLKEKYGITGAAISAVDVIAGLAKCLGMDIIKVPGATGYIDTNYEGKADSAVEALKTHDFVFVHLEGIDEVSHAQDVRLKIKAIEDFDSRLIRRVLSAVGTDVAVVVLPDHPVPVRTGKHTRTPVPVSARIPGVSPDSVMTFDEESCKHGILGSMQNGDLMNLLFGRKR